MDRWTLQQFRIFEAVARHRSYTRAAEELNLTQPAVYIQVRRLVPTRAGEETMAAATEVLSRLRHLSATMAELKGTVGGPLRVAMVTSAKYFMPDILAKFLRLHPNVQPQLTVANRAHVLERLTARRDDFCVMGQVPDGLDLAAHAVMENLLVPIAPAGHPLAGNRMLPLEALAGEPFLMREAGSGTRDAVERTMAEQGLALATTMELGSTEAIKRAVIAGLGVSVLSLSSLDFELAAGRLALLKVEGFPLRRTWFAVHPRGKQLGPTAGAFLSLLMQEGEGMRKRNSGVNG